jgi:hypothetical protein
MTGTVTGDCAQVEVASVQAGDSRSEMVVAYRLTDVELIDLHTLQLAPLALCIGLDSQVTGSRIYLISSMKTSSELLGTVSSTCSRFSDLRQDSRSRLRLFRNRAAKTETQILRKGFEPTRGDF